VAAAGRSPPSSCRWPWTACHRCRSATTSRSRSVSRSPALHVGHGRPRPRGRALRQSRPRPGSGGGAVRPTARRDELASEPDRLAGPGRPGPAWPAVSTRYSTRSTTASSPGWSRRRRCRARLARLIRCAIVASGTWKASAISRSAPHRSNPSTAHGEPNSCICGGRRRSRHQMQRLPGARARARGGFQGGRQCLRSAARCGNEQPQT